MKHILMIVVAMILMLPHANAQKENNVVEERFYVAGNCGMCEKRIEEAAYGKGVKYADWDKETGMLSVSFRRDKTNLAEIAARVAKAGHESEGFQADSAVYDLLPACCSYKTNNHRH